MRQRFKTYYIKNIVNSKQLSEENTFEILPGSWTNIFKTLSSEKLQLIIFFILFH